MEKTTNRQILFLFGTLIVLALVSAGGSANFNADKLQKSYYLNQGFSGFGNQFLTFIILYNNLIPIR